MMEHVLAWWKAMWSRAVEIRQRIFDNDDDWPDDWGFGV